jgi:hypothetical protein
MHFLPADRSINALLTAQTPVIVHIFDSFFDFMHTFVHILGNIA